MITVFTPAYNRANLLPRLYESLKQQTFKDFEWVLVDDGSTDNTRETVQNFIDENVIVIRYFIQPNAGKHVAVNRGVKEADRELFFIVDSDDYLIPGTLQFIADKAKAILTNPDFAGISGRKGYAENEAVGSLNFSEVIEADTLDFRFKYKIEGDMAEIYKTEVLRKYPFPESADEKFCPEALVWNRIAQHYKMVWYPNIIYLFQFLNDGLTKNIVTVRKRSPINTCLYYAELEKMPIPVLQKLKANINYWRFSIYTRTPFLKKLRQVSLMLSIAGLPLSWWLALRDA